MNLPIQISNWSNSGADTTLEQIFIDFGAIRMWSSEKRTIEGSTTILHDYAGIDDLSNPSPITQPSVGAGRLDKEHILFDGAGGDNQCVMKSIPNFLSEETQGEIHSVFRAAFPYSLIVPFCSSDESTDNIYGGLLSDISLEYGDMINLSNGYPNVVKVNPLYASFINDGGTYLISFGSNGSNYLISENSINYNTNIYMLAGLNNGDWFASLPNRDNISIGARLGFSKEYSYQYWWTTIITPVLTDEQRIDLHNRLRAYYGF